MSTLHITNGDCAAGTLRTFLDDPVAITCDPLFEGPAAAVDDDAWHELRAGAFDDGRSRPIREEMAARDRELIDHRGEILLWFEHDLFDQLLLIRALDLIRRRSAPRRVSLICIDRFPGIEPFYGLGQLTAAQLGSLQPTQQVVTADQFDLATTAWNAFRSPDPTLLADLASAPWRTAALPFLGAALRRFLSDYPSTTNGLSTTAQHVLDALDNGANDGGALFRATQAREVHPFMGDWSLFNVVRALASSRTPLATIDPRDDRIDLRPHRIAITEAGRAVRAGDVDAVRLNGIDEWHGGVRLTGADSSPWRWDAGRETLISLG